MAGELVLNVHPPDLPWIELHSTLSLVYGGLIWETRFRQISAVCSANPDHG